LPLTFGARLEKGETVLVQGATGFAGRLAVQVAKKLGAGRVVGSGRDPASLRRLFELGADAIIDLGQPDAALAAAFKEEAGKKAFDVILDFVWGRPTEVLLRTLVPEGLGFASKRTRLVQIGESAGREIALQADMLRTSGLEIMGASAGIVPHEVPGLASQVFDWIRDGELRAEVERIRLEDVPGAWGHEVHGKRLVVIP
jgi:NADPH2:quinone reductase